MGLPYDDNDTGYTDTSGLPMGAIRAMMRSPSTTATPRPITAPRAPTAYPPMMTPRPSAPEFNMPMPSMQSNNQWGDIGKLAVDTLGKFGEKPKGIKDFDFDKELAGIRKNNADLAATLAALKQQPSGGYGAPQDTSDYNKTVRGNESGMNDEAVNTASGATGRYQFLPSTAKGLMPELDLKDLKKPEIQEELMKRYTDLSVKALKPIIGDRKPTNGELYLLHFLGQQGGTHVLKNLAAPITETIAPEAIRQNASFLRNYKTGDDLLRGLSAKFGG